MFRTVSMAIRVSESDVMGHVNNTHYFGYLADATASIFTPDAAHWLLAEEVVIRHFKPAYYGRQLMVEIQFADNQMARYVLRQGGTIVAQAHVRWRLTEGLATAVTLQHESAPEATPLRRRAYAAEPVGNPFQFMYRVETSDVMTRGALNAGAFMRWGAEAIAMAVESHGWNFERSIQADCLVTIKSRELQIFDPPPYLIGQYAVVVARVQAVGRVQIVARFDYFLSNTSLLLATEFVTLAFTTRDGSIRERDDDLVEIALRGSPSPSLVI